MNAEQKQRMAHELGRWNAAMKSACSVTDLLAISTRMAALLQELMDAPDQVASVPDGWKLVPVIPTPEMIDAWNNDDSDEFRHAYRAMLEAAPQPPALTDERIFKLFLEKAVDKGTAGIYDFARAIEREILGEKA